MQNAVELPVGSPNGRASPPRSVSSLRDQFNRTGFNPAPSTDSRPPPPRYSATAPPPLPARPAIQPRKTEPPPLPKRKVTAPLPPPILPKRLSSTNIQNADTPHEPPRKLPPPYVAAGSRVPRNSIPQEVAGIDPSRSAPPLLPARPKLPPRQSTSNLKPKDSVAASSALTDGQSGTELVAPAPQKIDPRSFGFRPHQTFAPPPVRSNSVFPSAPSATPPPVPKTTKPPPIPLASKPPPSINQCLKCRDFSQADSHAARFPRQAYSDLRQLSQDLTAPFGSLTDKARVIFIWLHFNVRYDVDAFFGNRVQPSTPKSTLQTGLAVCEGYAGLFAELAKYAGMEVIVVGGHGKGFGFNRQPVPPPQSAGHAWNAVRIDGGQWHLVDPCWGAGNVEVGKYNQVFAPYHFTCTTEEFRRKHFPDNPDNQFCQRRIDWAEYYFNDDGPQMYSTLTHLEFNYSENSILPAEGQLRPNQRYTFRITKACAHLPVNDWLISVKAGKGDNIMAPDGSGGLVVTATTGGSGSQVTMSCISKFKGQDAKGLTKSKFEDRSIPGSYSWEYKTFCRWQVA